MPTNSERLVEAAQTLPEPLLVEILDFADFLRAKQLNQQRDSAKVRLTGLCGGLEDSKTFGGSPLAIQQQLRNEWR